MTRDQIKELLETNDLAVCRALVALNEKQTETERNSEQTINNNNQGFRPCHARMGTSMAKQYLTRNFLSAKQIAYWRKPMACGNTRIGIYATQLAKIAENKKKAKEALPIEAEYIRIEREMIT